MGSYWRNLLGFTFLVAGVTSVMMAVFGIPYYGAYSFLHPERLVPSRTPAALGMFYEDVRFRGDGIDLAGWFIPGNTRRTIIVLGGIHEPDRSASDRKSVV